MRAVIVCRDDVITVRGLEPLELCHVECAVEPRCIPPTLARSRLETLHGSVFKLRGRVACACVRFACLRHRDSFVGGLSCDQIGRAHV